MRRASTVATALAAAVTSVIGLSISWLGASCFGGNCSHAQPGVDVTFVGVTTSGVASLTVSGACGPVPSPLCDPKQPGCGNVGGWDVYVPGNGAGSCAVHVVLQDGEVFDDTVTLKFDSSCGVSGYYGDHVVIIRSMMVDASSEG